MKDNNKMCVNGARTGNGSSGKMRVKTPLNMSQGTNILSVEFCLTQASPWNQSWLGPLNQAQLQPAWEAILDENLETGWVNVDADSVLTEPYSNVRDEDCQMDPQLLRVHRADQTEL